MDMERVHRMLIAAIYASNSNRKQYYLLEIADELGIPAKEWDIAKETAPMN